MDLLNLFSNPSFWYGVLRSTVPILFAALAALVAKRAGIINMAIEGIMLFGALAGVIGSAMTQSALVGFICAVVVGVFVTMLLAVFKIRMEADEILVAIALNLLAQGLTIFILYLVSGEKATSSKLPSVNLPVINIPLVDKIPFLGKVISGQNIMVYVALASVFIIHFLLFKTPLGLRIRSVGGNKDAAASVGVSVEKTQYIAMAISGVLGGMAGGFLSMGYMSMFTKGMSSGRGYIALAAANVGGNAPYGTLASSLLFGLFESLANNLQGKGIPVEFVQMIPYFATIVMFTFMCYRRKTQKQRRAKKLQAQQAAN